MLVDEAYFDFVDRPDAGRTMSLARERPNLLVTAHVQQGPRAVRPARGLRRGRGRVGRRPSTRCASPSTPTPSRRRPRSRACATPPTLDRRVAGGGRRARAHGARRSPRPSVGLYPQPGQLYPGAAGFRSGRRILRCPRAAPAPRRDRARRRRARAARGACGSPSGPRTRTRCSCRRVRSSPARPPARADQDGQGHDDRDAAGRHRGAGAPRRSSASSRRAPAPTPRAASSSRSSARSATTARSSPRSSSRASPGSRRSSRS